MREDTKIGGAQSKFPVTRLSAIAALRSDNPAERNYGYEAIIQAYWRPVYKYIRLKWQKSNEDAKDLTQGFFTQAMEKDYFNGFDPKIARFRTFLRRCLDGFVANSDKAAKRIKRGGDRQILSLDFETAENELRFADVPDGQPPDNYFDREWMRSLFTLSVHSLQAKLESQNKHLYFEVFKNYDLIDAPDAEKPTYAQLAQQFNLPSTQITNLLAYSRREFRKILLDKLREVTVSEQEFRDEARAILGVAPQ